MPTFTDRYGRTITTTNNQNGTYTVSINGVSMVVPTAKAEREDLVKNFIEAHGDASVETGFSDHEDPMIDNLPIAATTKHGIVKVGSGLEVTSDGILSNEFSLGGSNNNRSATQLDTVVFTDLIQSGGPSTTVAAQGGVFFLSNGNGGSVQNNSTSTFTAFGIGNSSGTCVLTSGTTNNNTGYSKLITSPNILPGIPTPDSGLLTIYECEALIRTDATIFENTTPVHGEYQFGFTNSTTNAAPADGIYFSRLVNGSTNETTWQVVFAKDGTAERVNTGVTVAANKTYRMYLRVQRFENGNILTTYKIKNMTDNSNTEGVAVPSNTARYPTASADYLGVTLGLLKAGTASTASRSLLIDYVGARIRRPLAREILLFSEG